MVALALYIASKKNRQIKTLTKVTNDVILFVLLKLRLEIELNVH